MESNKTHILGATYFTINLIFSTLADAFAKQLGLTLSVSEIVSLRCILSALCLLPFIGKMQIGKHTKVHLLRSLMSVAALWLCTYGVTKVQIVVVTIVAFTVPLFTLVFSALLLKEKVKAQRWIASIIGFCGIYVCSEKSGYIDMHILALLASSCIFALMDVFNKMVVDSAEQVPMLDSLFFSSLFSGIIVTPLALFQWRMPNIEEFCLASALGVTSDAIFFFLLKSYKHADLSALASYRYLELIFAAVLGYFWFSDIPTTNTWIAAGIVVCTSIWSAYCEHSNSQNPSKLAKASK
jgi:S-adenosylmethionine uptake transporter